MGRAWAGYIAVDWGTSNRRAYRMSAGGFEAEFEDGLGVLEVPAGGFDAAVQQIRVELGDLPMLMAGMVGSNRGWREAPYAPCPADADDLANGILWVEPGRTGIVPGVALQGARPDVMRGEEVQALGAVAAGLVPADCLLGHPGTHAKWIGLEAGRIAGFRTRMTGEIFALLKAHSILAQALAAEVTPGDGFARGVADALAGVDLLAGLFGVRARVALGRPDDEAGYASGLLIGADVCAALDEGGGRPIALVGRPELCDLYRAALGQAGREAVQVDGAEALRAGIGLLVERFA